MSRKEKQGESGGGKKCSGESDMGNGARMFEYGIDEGVDALHGYDEDLEVEVVEVIACAIHFPALFQR